MRRFSLLLFAAVLFSVTMMAQEVGEKKFACIGNSVTFGYGHNSPSETSYPTRLQQMLGDGFVVRNFGHSGATLLNKGHRPYTQQKVYSQVLEFAPDYAVIHLGLNDTDPRNWPNYRDEFIPDYLSLIDTLRAVNPSVKVWVCRMTPIFNWHKRFKSGTRDWFWQIQEAIEQVAQISGAGLIDFHEPLYYHPDLFADALHPDAEGAQILANTVYTAVIGNYGGLSLPEIYSSNMVIQRGKPFVLQGKADAGAEVKARLGKQKRKVTAGANGKWSISFDAMEATRKPLKLSVESGGKELLFDNIVVGEVWLCSGQSNMAFMVKESSHKSQSLANVQGKDIRLYNMKPRVYTDNVEWDSIDLVKLNRHDYYLPTEWQIQNEANVSDFSAVAYHFGAMLADSLDVPVGLICNAIGGAPAESFIDRKTLEFHPVLVDILYNWRSNDMIQDWCRGRAGKNIAKSSNKLQRHPYEPCYLYENGIAPIVSYPIKGAIWYQGESNAHNVELHEVIFKALVDSWRTAWNDSQMPFYFVQLSSINRPSWPHFRDSQRRLAEAVPYCDFAVSSDKGNPTDVHPKEKAPVGERLARLALNGTYGMKHVVQHGPTPVEAKVVNGKTVIEFSDAIGLNTSDGKALRGFEYADAIGSFKTIDNDKIKIDGSRIIIELAAARVRYAWRPYTDANLINSEGLPASTFEIKVK